MRHPPNSPDFATLLKGLHDIKNLPHVIKIDCLGRPSGIRRKQGYDLSKMPLAQQTERVSDILWDADSSKWYIHFVKGPYKGEKATFKHLPVPPKRLITTVMKFQDRATAEKVEVLIFNHLINENLL